MLKRVDLAVYNTIKEGQLGQFKAGVERAGLKTQGVDYALDKFNETVLDAEIRKKTDEVKTKIINGKISVPDYYKLKK